MNAVYDYLIEIGEMKPWSRPRDPNKDVFGNARPFEHRVEKMAQVVLLDILATRQELNLSDERLIYLDTDYALVFRSWPIASVYKDF